MFFDLFPAVVKTLDVISENSAGDWNTESSRKAGSLLHSITMFQFLISFVIANRCLGYVKGLTVSLQKKANDICLAYKEITSVVTALTDLRENIDDKQEWYGVAESLGQKVNAPGPQLPRHCNLQTSRNNTPGDMPEVYYRRTVSIPFLDELLYISPKITIL